MWPPRRLAAWLPQLAELRLYADRRTFWRAQGHYESWLVSLPPTLRRLDLQLWYVSQETVERMVAATQLTALSFSAYTCRDLSGLKQLQRLQSLALLDWLCLNYAQLLALAALPELECLVSEVSGLACCMPPPCPTSLTLPCLVLPLLPLRAQDLSRINHCFAEEDSDRRCLLALPRPASLAELRLSGWELQALPGGPGGLPTRPPPLLCMPRLEVGCWGHWRSRQLYILGMRV